MPAPLHTIAVALLIGALPAALAAAAQAESPERTDALAVFARQAATASRPTGPAPAPIGLYLWGGRADIEYKPFFQWELRMQGGSAGVDHVRARIATLSPTRTLLVQGDWMDWPAIGAGASVDVHYRTHCPTFSAFQLELAWSGGGETYLACDKGAIPIPLSSVKDQGCAVAVNVQSDAEPGATSARITWTDWNIGGKPARGVMQILHLRDQNLKEVKAFPLPLKGELAAGAVVPQKTTLEHVPAFATCSISIEEAEESMMSDPPGFTNAQDVEIAEVRPVHGQLEAKVRNGLATAVDGVVISLTLQDKKGAALAKLELTPGHLNPGEIKPITAPLGAVTAWASYESSWSMQATSTPTPAATTAPTAAEAAVAAGTPRLPPAVEADHLSFTPASLVQMPTGWLLSGRLANHRGTQVGPLDVRLLLQDRAGEHEEVACRTGALADGGAAGVSFAVTLADIARFQLSWRLLPTGP